jgi:hypothetical protein
MVEPTELYGVVEQFVSEWKPGLVTMLANSGTALLDAVFSAGGAHRRRRAPWHLRGGRTRSEGALTTVSGRTVAIAPPGEAGDQLPTSANPCDGSRAELAFALCAHSRRRPSRWHPKPLQTCFLPDNGQRTVAANHSAQFGFSADAIIFEELATCEIRETQVAETGYVIQALRGDRREL